MHPTDEDWLSGDVLVQAFKAANPQVPAEVLHRLLEGGNLVHGLYARPPGSDLDPQVAFSTVHRLLGGIVETSSVIFQAGLTRVLSPDGRSAEVGFMFAFAYAPPAGEKPIVQLLPLNRGLDGSILSKRVNGL